jgi:hypothetical protein
MFVNKKLMPHLAAAAGVAFLLILPDYLYAWVNPACRSASRSSSRWAASRFSPR